MEIKNNYSFSNQWLALSSTEEKNVLFYNKKSSQLENMTYNNRFTKLFKILWYYLNGYTKSENAVFKGIENLLKNTTKINQEDWKNSHLSEFMKTARKVHDRLGKMETSFEKENKYALVLAASSLAKRLEDILSELKEMNSQEETNGENSEETASTAPTPAPASQDVLLPPSTSQETPPPTAAPQEASAPIGAPPPPPLLPNSDPKKAKEEKIKKLEKEISETEKLLAYLELQDLKNSKEYKTYESAKGSLQVVLNNSEEHKKFSEKIGPVIASIEKQLKEGKNEIEIMQDNEPKEFSVSVAEEFLSFLKEKQNEIEETKQRKKDHEERKEETGSKTVKYEKENIEISCRELEKRLEQKADELKELIEENKDHLDIKFQDTKLSRLKNNLLIENGEQPIKKPVKRVVPPQQTPPKEEENPMEKLFEAIKERGNKPKEGPDINKI